MIPESQAVWGRVWRVLDQAVASGAFPGASAWVGAEGRCVATYTCGKLSLDPEAPAVTAETCYDLASVTKPIVAAGALALVDRGLVGLDEPLGDRLPPLKLQPLRAGITLRQLLTHTSGFPSYPEFYREHGTAEALRHASYAAPMAYLPGMSVLYSSLGYQAVGDLIEAVSGERLDEYLAREVLRPCGMDHAGFCPPPDDRAAIAPTEHSWFRSRLLQGEVHDENAGVLGGVCGHAGLFAAAEDVGRFGLMLIGGGQFRWRVLKPETVADMMQEQTEGMPESRGLGLVLGDREFGRYLRTAGHTGFTGTSLCLAPDKGVVMVLLTNRVHPTRTNPKIHTVRRQFHDAVAALFLGRE